MLLYITSLLMHLLWKSLSFYQTFQLRQNENRKKKPHNQQANKPQTNKQKRTNKKPSETPNPPPKNQLKKLQEKLL